MEVREDTYQRIGIFGVVLIGLLVGAYGGLSYIYGEGYGLIYEVSYAILLLIVLAIAFDRLFVR